MNRTIDRISALGPLLAQKMKSALCTKLVSDMSPPPKQINLTRLGVRPADVEVARLDGVEDRAIVVPIEVGAGAQKRRFKLSIRLHLDPVD